jgi:microcystin-dependent protein
MTDPYLGEIRMFGGNFAPVGWQMCDGHLLSIAEYDALFNLLGTTYGGDGQNTFAVPDLRGRTGVHQGQLPGGGSYTLGQQGGAASVTLLATQLPSHTHPAIASTSAATSASPSGGIVAAWADSPYSDAAPSAQLASEAVGAAGGSQPHDNMPPYLVVSHIIAVYGIYPSQS